VHPWFCRAHGGGAAALAIFIPAVRTVPEGIHAIWDQSPGDAQLYVVGPAHSHCVVWVHCVGTQQGDFYLLDHSLALYESKRSNGLDGALLGWM